jgi:repressor LexA
LILRAYKAERQAKALQKVDDRREKMYAFIVKKVDSGISPTVREICTELRVSSTSTVHSDLRALREEGRIEMEEGLNRSIRLPGAQVARAPLVEAVAAGEPLFSARKIERFIPVSIKKAQNKELFALRVRGDSMIGAAILDGDIVVVERASEAEDGQIVVALLDGEATVKRFYKDESPEGPVMRLQPENDAMEPILLHEVTILGRVLAVHRYY